MLATDQEISGLLMKAKILQPITGTDRPMGSGSPKNGTVGSLMSRSTVVLKTPPRPRHKTRMYCKYIVQLHNPFEQLN